jgi:phage gp29-like protein
MRRIIRPEAQARWLLPSLSLITPQYIEAILRGALVGSHVFQWQLFDLMEDTWPRLVKNLNEVKRAGIAELRERWLVEPWAPAEEGAAKESQDRQRLVEEALFGMTGAPALNENALDASLYDALDSWAKGTSLLEINYEMRESATMGTIVAPRSTYWVHPSNYAWGSDGNLRLIVQGSDPDSEPRLHRDVPSGRGGTTYLRTDTQINAGGYDSMMMDIPEDKFIVAICKARTGHPLGGALLRPLAWWWCASNFSADWLLNLAQIFGLPIRWATYLNGAPNETVDAICDMLANLGSAGWAAFPQGTQIELKEPSGSSREYPQSTMLDRCDTQCDLLILGQTLTTQVRREGGSRALGEVHNDVRKEVVDAVARFLAELLNEQFIPSILRLNYGDQEMRPRFVPKDEEDPEAAKAAAEVLQIAVATGIPVPVDYALSKLGIPRAADGEEIVKMPTPAAAQTTGGKTESGKQKAENQARRNPDKSGLASLVACCDGIHAKDSAQEKLVQRVLEDLTGVEAKWLGGVKPFFRKLVQAAESGEVSDQEFIAVLKRAQAELPELFAKLDRKALAAALENAMGSAVVNGAVRGAIERRRSGSSSASYGGLT